MFKRAMCALAVIVCLSIPARVHAQGQYIDVTTFKVKPEKSADFEAYSKKIADVNRRGNGDHFLAMETVYGEGNTYTFASRREDYADIDKANEAFMGALTKAYGKDGADKMFRDINNCVISMRTELRVRRLDLSSKTMTDPQALNKLVGGSRVQRTLAIHVRPGRTAEFENMMKEINARADNYDNAQPVLVSEVVEGGRGDTFYISFFRGSLGGFDRNPSLEDIVGKEGLAKIDKTFGEITAGSESAIYQFVPELSNPPQEIAEVAADFWNPKAKTYSAMANPKPKAATAPKTSAQAETPDKPKK
jgi:hypothetical protein